ncbi:MAG TPA: hypothetical protein VMG58_17515 [Candidatus Sulfotelmatobacter sp.]|nr:hypothetical protein [Candidatus Sulfotelmatobacter sp.]
MGRRDATYGALALLALFAGMTACASIHQAATPLPLSADLRTFTAQVNEAVANDPELSPVFGAFEPSGTDRPEAEPFGRVIANGTAWAKLTGLQRSHVLKKLAASFTRLFLESPARTADTATIDVVADKRHRVGWFTVRPSKRDYTYHLSSYSSGDAWQRFRMSL